MSSARRARVAVVASLALVLVIVWLVGGLPRRWNLVVIVWQTSGEAAEMPTPRRDALAVRGARFPYASPQPVDDEDLERWVAPLLAAGWTHHAPALQGTEDAGTVVEANLEALSTAASPGPLQNIFLVRTAGSDRAELDVQLGRLMDGLAGPLASSRTLYVVVDVAASEIHLGGPRNFDSDGLSAPEGDLAGWFAGLMRLADS